MSVIEGEKAYPTFNAGAGDAASIAGYKGTEGLFAAIQGRGNVESGFNAAAAQLTEFDNILRNLDTQELLKKTCFS